MLNGFHDLLFPPRAIESLADLRGETWRRLVRDVNLSGHQSLETLAFMLMMSRLTGCASCNSDSYRASQGCIHCSKQFLQRYRGSDKELVALFNKSKIEITKYQRT